MNKQTIFHCLTLQICVTFGRTSLLEEEKQFGSEREFRLDFPLTNRSAITEMRIIDGEIFLRGTDNSVTSDENELELIE